MRFCTEKIEYIDYKDVPAYAGTLLEKGKIFAAEGLPETARITRRQITTAIKKSTKYRTASLYIRIIRKNRRVEDLAVYVVRDW